MEQLSLLQLSSPKSEFYEPAASADLILSTSYELSSVYIALVQENSFSGRDCENPYHHLREFEQVCSCKKISGMTHETLKWKLFPFSLSGEAKQWYIRVVGCVNGSWIELRDRFCSAFFPLLRICALRTEILTFRQNDKESIGVAWARFTLLVKSGPDLSLPDVDAKINTLESEGMCSPSHGKSTKRASQFDLKLTREKTKSSSRAYRL